MNHFEYPIRGTYSVDYWGRSSAVECLVCNGGDNTAIQNKGRGIGETTTKTN